MAELNINQALFDKMVRMADALDMAIDGLQEMANDYDSFFYGCVHDVQAGNLLLKIKDTIAGHYEELDGSDKKTMRMRRKEEAN
jgi:hypothetical protein